MTSFHLDELFNQPFGSVSYFLWFEPLGGDITVSLFTPANFLWQEVCAFYSLSNYLWKDLSLLRCNCIDFSSSTAYFLHGYIVYTLPHSLFHLKHVMHHLKSLKKRALRANYTVWNIMDMTFIKRGFCKQGLCYEYFCSHFFDSPMPPVYRWMSFQFLQMRSFGDVIPFLFYACIPYLTLTTWSYHWTFTSVYSWSVLPCRGPSCNLIQAQSLIHLTSNQILDVMCVQAMCDITFWGNSPSSHRAWPGLKFLKASSWTLLCLFEAIFIQVLLFKGMQLQ